MHAQLHPVFQPLATRAADPAAVIAEASRSWSPVGHLALTDRERDVAELAVYGFSYAQIARNLYVAQSTVGYHLSNIYAKCGVSSRHELTELVRSRAMAATQPVG